MQGGVADRMREYRQQGAGGQLRDAADDSIVLPAAALETTHQVPIK